MATQVMTAKPTDALKAITMEQRALAQARVFGGLMFLDIEAAVDLVYPKVLRGRKLRLAMADIEFNTRGQAFRVDTPRGPLFAQQCLWEFAGRSGNEFTGSTGKEPTWPALPTAARAGRRAA